MTYNVFGGTLNHTESNPIYGNYTSDCDCSEMWHWCRQRKVNVPLVGA